MISNKRLIAISTQGTIIIKRGNGIWSSLLQKAPYEPHKLWIECLLTT
jgi:hypothetical protein